MTSRQAPEWLAQFQARFGAVIRTPLDRASGTLTATPSAYDPLLLVDALDGPKASGAERLAVYNRQYWFRFFDVLHAAFPLTARLLGHWHFNEFACGFLLANPPRGWDIDRATQGFDAFFSEALEAAEPPIGGARPPLERALLIEAARIDAAWHRVFAAPPAAPFRPSAEHAAELLDRRLMPSPAFALVKQHWPLLDLRQMVCDDPSEAPLSLPPKLDSAEWWALVRRPRGIGQLALEAREAELFELLERNTVRDALALLEAACSDEERLQLPDRARAWLARSVELEFWVGIDLGASGAADVG